MSQQPAIATNLKKEPKKLTAMHREHIRMGATMGDYAGWQRPSVYTSVEDELMVARTSAGICDVSPVGKLLLQGTDGQSVLQRALEWAKPLQVGEIQVGPSEGLDGTSSTAMALKLGHDELFISCAASEVRALTSVMTAEASSYSAGGSVHVLDMTSAYAGINIVGPKASDLLSKATDLDLHPGALTNLTCSQGQVAEIHAVVARWDQAGVLAYDLYFGREYGCYMWEVLLEAGEEYGILPVGVEAHQRLVAGETA